MILQLSTIVLTAMFTGIIIIVINFLIGVVVTRWWASKKEWDDPLKTALIINGIWFIIGLIFNIALSFVLTAYITSIIVIIIDILLGAVVVSKFYKKKFGKSLIFVIVIQIILFIISSIVIFILEPRLATYISNVRLATLY